MPITLRQLRYFDALVRQRHFGRAADLCAVTQPALSMQLRDLETELGVRLIDRTKDGLKLTEVGEEFAARAAAILSAVNDLEEQARARNERMFGPLRLGMIPSIAPYLLPRLLPELRSRFPELHLTLRETVTATLLREVADGMLHAALVSVPVEQPDLVAEPLFIDPFLLAVPASAAAAKMDRASEEMLSDGELLLLEDGHCLRDQALAVCRAIDPRRLRSFGASSLSTLLQLVAHGQGITLLPSLFVQAEAAREPGVRILRFVPPEPSRTIGLVWRRTSPRTEAFRTLGATVIAALSNSPKQIAESKRPRTCNNPRPRARSRQ